MPGARHTDPAETPGLQRWWQEHSELDALVEALCEAIERHSEAAASAALEELAEALDGHFSVEEEVYFPLVERLRPELAGTMKSARLAHVTVRDQLDELRACLARVDRARAWRVLHELLDLFHRHEELEGELIADLSGGAAG